MLDIKDLVQRYSDSLVRYAYCYLGDTSAAEDVMEEAFAILIFKKKQFAEESRAKAYLYKIVRNKSIDWLRRRGREMPLEDVEELLYQEDSHRGLMQADINRTLYICMQQLPTQYRDVLYLCYFDEFAIDQVCRIMKKNKKQVYNLLARAKAELKEKLIQEGITYEDI